MKKARGYVRVNGSGKVKIKNGDVTAALQKAMARNKEARGFSRAIRKVMGK